MRMPRKQVPEFAGEAEERAFRETHDTAGLVELSRAQRVHLPNLKPSTTVISLRLPAALLERIKLTANQRDVPYQSLIKLWLAEKVASERG